MADRGWSRRFATPLALADGRELATLRDAGEFIAGLPAWQDAAAELLVAAERGGIVMLAEIAMRRAINHGKPVPEKAPPRKAARRYRIIPAK